MKWFLFLLVSFASLECGTKNNLESEIESFIEEDSEELSPLEIMFNDEKTPAREGQGPAVYIHNRSEENFDEPMTQLAMDVDTVSFEPEAAFTPFEAIKEETKKSIQTIEISLRKVFAGAPIIYTILFLLSTVSVCVWLYSMLTIRPAEFLPPHLIKQLRTKLISNQFNEALDLCVKENHFFCKMLASGILARKHGLSVMLDNMKAEGKRSTISFWQRIGILNEIAVIAPMLGLLGTVLGMFYAFYDLNRSIESVSLLFDGLGVSVGTTVAGLLVAILAMILYSLAKYRLVRIIANVENEVQSFAALIDSSGPR